jgi:hypothetical protein
VNVVCEVQGDVAVITEMLIYRSLVHTKGESRVFHDGPWKCCENSLSDGIDKVRERCKC